MVAVLTNLILGVMLCTMSSNDANNFLNSLLLHDSNDKTNYVTTTMLQVMYAISALLLIFVIIHMCINNKRRCFIDHISDTVVIKLIDIAGKDSNHSVNAKVGRRKRNYGLPGEIITGAESEIDSL
jgi:hypothetical protein